MTANTNHAYDEISRAIRVIGTLMDEAIKQEMEATDRYGRDSESAAYARGLITAYGNALEEAGLSRDRIGFLAGVTA
jgi:hypothetical protein